MKTITRNDLWKSFQGKEKMTLVEAQTREEFDKSHIPGAICLDKNDVEAKAKTLLPDKNARIVVYGADTANNASPEVVKKLEAAGYTNVSDYKEGKADWIAAGHPVEGSITVASK